MQRIIYGDISHMNFSHQLKLFLEKENLSAAELSRKSGVSKQRLSDWMSGAPPRQIEEVKKVADVLSTTLDHLLFGQGLEQNGKERVTDLENLLGSDWISGIFEVRFRRLKNK